MKIARISTGALALAIATPALGQVTMQDEATAPTSASQQSDVGGADIVVTGEKTNRTLQRTPASVAVTTNKTITDQNLVDLYDVLQRTPNVTPQGNHSDFTIRGIDAFNSIGGEGALASVYLDGAVLPQPALLVGPLDLYDVAQVEVFRGPQSTVQGRNALAGAVIIRTTDPTYDWNGRARVQLYSPSGERRAAGAIGGPIVDGQVAFRLSGEVAATDGFIRNVTVNQQADARNSETVRGKLLLTPTFAPGLRIVATYLHDRHTRGTLWSEFDAPYSLDHRVSTEDYPDHVAVRSDIGTLEAGYDLAPGLSLSSITNYSNVRERYRYDQDRSAATGNQGLILDPRKTFQQELRFNIDKSWIKGLIGGYYLRENNLGYSLVSTQAINLRALGVDETLLGMGVPAPVVDAVINLYGGTVPVAVNLRDPKITRNYAGFFDLTFLVTSRLRFEAGLRYDNETQDRGATQTVTINKPLPDPATVSAALRPIVTSLNALLNGIADGANSADPRRPVSYHAWLPKAAILYDLTPDVLLSFTAQRGYRAGGAGLNQARAQYYTYNPEYTWNYELALRSDFLDHRLTANANIYYIDWRDQQVSVSLTPGSAYDVQTVNAGKSRLYGGELSLTGRPTGTLSLYGGLGYSNTRYIRFTSTIGSAPDFSGNQFPNAPHWTASAGGTWHSREGLFANVNATYQSGRYQDALNLSVPSLRPLTLVNAKVGWQGEHVGMFLIASNIFDVQRPTQSFVDNDGRTRGVVSEPRVIGLSLEGRF